MKNFNKNYMLTEQITLKVFKHLKFRTNTANWSFVHPEIKSNESIVYRLSSPDFSKDLALKIYNNGVALSKIESQYSAIDRFHTSNITCASRYRVPEPFGLFAEDGFYLMEWVKGKSLRDTLWKNCLLKGQLQKHISEAYKWLNRYHEDSNLNLVRVDILTYSKSIESISNMIGAQNFCNNNEIFKSGFETLNNFADKFTGYETYHVDIHGDLNLGNIILNENHVTGIDIGATKHAPIQNDLAQMLNYICVNYFNMLTRFDMKKDVSHWEIFNVVLDAYEYPTNKKEREFFLFVFLYQVLRRWISTQHLHKYNKEHTAMFVILGKWRLYNSAVIAKGLTKAINDQYLK